MDANGALPAAMNSPAITESTPERNRSNVDTVTGVSPARTIWHYTWNVTPKPKIVNWHSALRSEGGSPAGRKLSLASRKMSLYHPLRSWTTHTSQAQTDTHTFKEQATTTETLQKLECGTFVVVTLRWFRLKSISCKQKLIFRHLSNFRRLEWTSSPQTLSSSQKLLSHH